MKIFIIALSLLLCAASPAYALVDTPTTPPEYISNQVIVQFSSESEPIIAQKLNSTTKDSSLVKRIINWFSSFGKSREETFVEKSFNEVSQKLKLSDFNPKGLGNYSPKTIKLEGAPKLLTSNQLKAYLFEFENGTVPEAVESFKQLSFVTNAQPNYIYKFSTVPNDPQYQSQWSHQKTHIEEAWDISTGNRNITIAVIDSGIEINHPDLYQNRWIGTVNGQTVNGWDFIYDDPIPDDTGSHGTQVAGVAAAVGNNGQGIAGVNWQASIMALRTGETSGTDSYHISRALEFAVNHGADVINMSFGATIPCVESEDIVVNDGIAYTVRVKGIVVVAATGNETMNAECDWPSYHPDVIAATAVDENDTPTSYSNYGPLTWKEKKIIAAPVGDGIPTTTIGGNYSNPSGTSFAAPYIAGVAALVLSVYDVDPFTLRQHLIDTADEINSDFTLNEPNPAIPNDDGKRTYGKRVNVYNALSKKPGTLTIQTPTPSVSTTPSTTPNPFSLPTPTISTSPTPTVQITPTPVSSGIPDNTTQQVDWVYEGQGRCWSAWAAPVCNLQSHEGSATLALRDFDQDGQQDVVCTEGNGTSQSTTITNLSNKSFSLSCERYVCRACVAAYTGIHAQCDGGNFQNPTTQKDTITLTPGCIATCTPSGAYGSCLSQQTPPQQPIQPGNPSTPQPPVPTGTPAQPGISPSPTKAVGTTPGETPVTDEFIADIFARINQKRTENGLTPYVYNEKLSIAAQKHAEDMAAHNLCSHTGSDNSDLMSRIKQTGYLSLASGEIIACQFSTPEFAVEGWWTSPGHHDMIVSRLMKEIGIGYAALPNNPKLFMVVADMAKNQ